MGAPELPVYQLDELLGTKMRALDQRKKGCDLFDLRLALQSDEVNSDRIVECFQRYITHEGVTVSRAEFGANLAEKLESKMFLEEIKPLTPIAMDCDPALAAHLAQSKLIEKLPGEPWKGR